MNRPAREFLQSMVRKLDEMLAALPQDEQHDLLDGLAGEIEERLNTLIESDGEGLD